MSGVSRDKNEIFRGTKGLAPAASHFIKNGYYTSSLPGTKQYYDYLDEERKRCGKLGHEFVMSDDASMSATAMSNLFIEHMDTTFEKWTPRKRFTMFKA